MEYREFRAEVAEDDAGKLWGTAAPFNSETTIGRMDRGGWREVIAPGAFTKALKESDTVLLCDHDMAKPLARVSAGTLRLRESEEALEFDADVVDTTYARDMRANIKAKNKGGMSIGFDPVKDEWFDDDGNPSNRMLGTKRILREVRLPEVSSVTNPAYKRTTVFARDDSNALLEARQRAAERETGELDALRELVEWAEERASSVSTADRKALAAKGHALPDGSYPIPDVSHLHSAAVLAASHHGNWKAAKALIRKRAKALGVDVTTLPGFGKQDNEEDANPERRIKKGTAKRVLQIDAELKQALELFGSCDAGKLPEEAQKALALVSGAAEHIEHIAHKENLSADVLPRSQEPDTSTPGEEDDDALLARAALARQRSRELGLL